jgi:thiol-disulfide isomerase/thioredoxin
MAKSAALSGLLAGCIVLAGSVPAWAQAPSVETMLDARFAPKHKDVSIATPTAADLKTCTVKAIPGNRAGSTGWELSDAKNQPIRRYFGGKGAKGGVDTWCYFKDGVEVYREIDTRSSGSPDQFRWFNSAGLKWGTDRTGKGKIDSWRIISAEEVGFEAFQAVAAGDYARLQALFITAEEMQAMKLPAKEITRLSGLQKLAPKKFAELVKALPNLASATFERVETAVPSCVPGESIGAESDLIKFASRAVFYSASGAKKETKHDWLHTGELIQVGFAWRLVDVPGTEDSTPNATGATPVASSDPRVNDLLEKIGKLDTEFVSLAPGTAKYKTYMEARIALVRSIIPLTNAKDRDGWYKQLFDNWSGLAQGGDTAALKNLAELSNHVADQMPGSSLAAYGAYRDMWARYSLAVAGAQQTNVEKIQKGWVDQLTKFVQTYPKAEDTTPDALHQLAMHHEFFGDDKQAKGYYELAHSKFPTHYLAEKCKGAARRLDLPGKKLELAAPELQTAKPFDIANIKDKLVVVYYWATSCEQCIGDFARLNKIVDTHPGKVELVCVNLDDTDAQAIAYLKTTVVKGTHLFQAPPANTGGMSSALALQYGINGLPTVFLIGRDGRVVTRSMQMSDLENELKKAP